MVQIRLIADILVEVADVDRIDAVRLAYAHLAERRDVTMAFEISEELQDEQPDIILDCDGRLQEGGRGFPDPFWFNR